MAGRGGGRRAHSKTRGNGRLAARSTSERAGTGRQRFSGGGQGSWIPSESTPSPLSPPAQYIRPPSPQLARGPMTTCARCTASVPPTFNPSVLASLALSLSLLPAFGSASVCLHRRCVYQVDGQSQDRFLSPHAMRRHPISPYQVCCCYYDDEPSTIDRSLCLCSMPMFICI